MDGPCSNTEPHDSHLYEPDEAPPGMSFTAICPGVARTTCHLSGCACRGEEEHS